MSPSAEILDLEGARSLPPASDSWTDLARRFVLEAASGGVTSLVANAPAEAYLLRVNEHQIPVLLPVEGRDPTVTDLISPRSHYIGYSREEIGKRRRVLPGWLITAAFAPLEWIFRWGRGEAIVYLNNWLLPTNPMFDLNIAALRAATRVLVERFPDRAVVVRSVNPRLSPRLVDALDGAGFRRVRSRRVYLLDPRDGAYRKHKDVRTDRGLGRRTGYEIIADREVLSAQVDRLAALYRDLYLVKHSALNPHYSERFFRTTLDSGLLEYRGLMKEGRVDAFIAWHLRGGVMTGTVLGYDLSKPTKLGLYRQIFALLVAEADRLGVPLNLSAGAEQFKRQRGAIGVEEFEAIYDRHLAAPRRALWRLLAGIGRVAARRTSET